MSTPPVETLGFDGCEWPVDTGCFTDAWDALDAEVQERSIAFAGQVLRRLTGYRVGGCPITVRPCKKGCSGSSPSYYDRYASYGSYGAPWYPQNWGGLWINSCGCTDDCSCSELCEVDLPAPVGEVYDVALDGQSVPTSDYRLDGNRLVYTGALDCPWPVCQDMAASLNDPNTFGITYLNSYPVDGLGAYAAGVLAVEFAKACSGQKCRLPSGVTSVSRQGVSMEIATGLFVDNATGIREVDAYVSLWNPRGLRQTPVVWSPGVRGPRVTKGMRSIP